jgi:Icc-related predicted phosphoesterase
VAEVSVPGNGRRLKVAALGDVHASPSEVDNLRKLFRQVREEADVMVLCGDLTNLGTAPEAEALASALDRFGKPVIAVLGNHDHESGTPEAVQAPLEAAGVRFLETSTCMIEGVGFAGVKGFAGGFGRFMLSSFGEEPIKAFVAEALQQCLRLETSLRKLATDRVVVVLHYAPVVDTVMDEPKEIFPFLGSSRLAETIDRFDGIQAVVHGHAHHGTYEGRTRKGIPVFNVAAQIPKPTGKAYALIEV